MKPHAVNRPARPAKSVFLFDKCCSFTSLHLILENLYDSVKASFKAGSTEHDLSYIVMRYIISFPRIQIAVFIYLYALLILCRQLWHEIQSGAGFRYILILIGTRFRYNFIFYKV